MRFNDAVLGGILVLFGAFIIHEASTFPGLPGQSYGPAFFPTIIGVVLAACGAILIGRGIAQRKALAFVRFGAWASSPRHVVNFALVPVSLVAYILLADRIGFLPMSIGILSVLLFSFGCRMATSIGLAVGVTMLIHTVFYKFLLVPLPWGLLEPFAW